MTTPVHGVWAAELKCPAQGVHTLQTCDVYHDGSGWRVRVRRTGGVISWRLARLLFKMEPLQLQIGFPFDGAGLKKG